MANRLTKRRDSDVIKLMMSDFHVEVPDEASCKNVIVHFTGPEGTPYEGGTFRVQVTLPNDFPYSSPSIGFQTQIYHPNIDEISGSVCLNALNECWSPMFDLLNIFTMFLPHLLRYPNASDPLNAEAASLLLRDSVAYNHKVQKWVQNFAKGEPSSRKLSCEVLKTVEDKVEEATTPSTVAMGSTHSNNDEMSDMDLSDLEV
eukprot:549209_1